MYTENVSTAHLWQHSSHFTNINVCRVWWVRVGIQILRREFHAYIHLDYVRIKFLFYIKKNVNHKFEYIITLKCGILYDLSEKDLIRWLFIWFKVLIYSFLLGFDSIKLFKMYIKSKIYGWNVIQKTLWYMFMRVVETNIKKGVFKFLKKCLHKRKIGLFFLLLLRISDRTQRRYSTILSFVHLFLLLIIFHIKIRTPFTSLILAPNFCQHVWWPSLSSKIRYATWLVGLELNCSHFF